MTFPLRGLAAAFALTGLLTGASAACGDSTAENPDYGKPPDPNGFNPGNGGNDPYGGYGQGPSKVECPAALKRCTHRFTYPYANETSVILQGDYGGPGTWAESAGVEMKLEGNEWVADVQVTYDKPVEYKFRVNGQWESGENRKFEGKTCEEPTCEEEGELPPGVFDWRNAVIYFVLIDRFAKGAGASNRCRVPDVADIANYHGGNWAGTTEKINAGYFNDLGVNTLWITVPFQNFGGKGKAVYDEKQFTGFHGYWPQVDSDDANNLPVEDCYGSLDDLKTLIGAAHEKGLKVLFDYAMVHVHEASAIVGNHPTWFWPNSNGSGGNCVCGDPSKTPDLTGCSWDRDTEKCWFAPYLPHWNYKNDEARNWAVKHAVAWVKQTGVDGFRADAIKHVDMSWLTETRKAIEAVMAEGSPRQRFYMVGETYDFGNRGLLAKYVDPATKLDGQFDFPLRQEIANSVLMRGEPMSKLATFMDGNDYYYGDKALMSTFIGNHDLPRAIHLAVNQRPQVNGKPWPEHQGAEGKEISWQNQPGVVQEREAYERMANGFAVLYTNRGVPLVYYGDEIGLPGAGDPDNRRVMQFDNLNENQRWLKARLSKLGDIRSKHPALRRGIRSTIGSNNDTWTYMRETKGDTLYVAINRGDSAQNVSGLPAGALEDLVTGETVQGPAPSIPARTTRILVKK